MSPEITALATACYEEITYVIVCAKCCQDIYDSDHTREWLAENAYAAGWRWVGVEPLCPECVAKLPVMDQG